MGGIIVWMIKYRSFLIWFLAVVCVFSSGLYSGHVLCDLSKAKEERARQERINKMINDANEVSVDVEKKKHGLNEQRRKVQGEIYETKSNFGCHVDANGVRLLTYAISRGASGKSDK